MSVGPSYLMTIGNPIIFIRLHSKRNSKIYNNDRSARLLRDLIHEENARHKNTIEGMTHQTMSESEILMDEEEAG